MTIYKPNNPDRKQEKKPIADLEVGVDDKQPLTEKTASGNDVLLLVQRRPLTNQEVLRRRRRIRCAMILLLMLVVVAMALVVALLFNSRVLGSMYIGECPVNYHYDSISEPGVAAGQVGSAGNTDARGSFVESFEVDGSHEKLEIPPLFDFLKAAVIHDFDQNLTGIVDRRKSRCYVMTLDRSKITPPTDFLDLYQKMKNGQYMPDAKVIRERYSVVLPPVSGILEQFGAYIYEDCKSYDTYRLVKITEPLLSSKKKRSADCTMLGDGFCLGATFTDSMTCISLTNCA